MGHLMAIGEAARLDDLAKEKVLRASVAEWIEREGGKGCDADAISAKLLALARASEDRQRTGRLFTLTNDRSGGSRSLFTARQKSRKAVGPATKPVEFTPAEQGWKSLVLAEAARGSPATAGRMPTTDDVLRKYATSLSPDKFDGFRKLYESIRHERGKLAPYEIPKPSHERARLAAEMVSALVQAKGERLRAFWNRQTKAQDCPSAAVLIAVWALADVTSASTGQYPYKLIRAAQTSV